MDKKNVVISKYSSIYSSIDLPKHVFIQTNGKCNRSCSFCRFGMKDIKEEPIMEQEVFLKAVDELAEIDYRGRVSLFEMNEPLTDKRISSMIKHVSEKVPNCWQLLVTNGDYLTVEIAITLFKAGLNYLFVSSYSENHYRHIKGIARHLSRAYRQKLIAIAQYKFDFATDNRAGNLQNIEKLPEPLNESCGRVNSILYIKPGGEVVSCFGDYFNEQIMGNIQHDGVWGSWYGHKFGKLRESLNRGERKNLALCANCNVGKGETYHTHDSVKALSVSAGILGVTLVGGSNSTKLFTPHWKNNSSIKHVISNSGVVNNWPECEGLFVHNEYNLALKDPEVDCIFIANQSSLHFSYAKEALLSNKHVIIDKPIALSIQEVDALIEIAAKKKLLLGGVFQWRFCDVVKQVKEYIDTNALGSLLFINCNMHWLRGEDYYVRDRGTLSADGGGVLIKQAIHFIDLITFFGGECKEVNGFIDNSNIENSTEKSAVMCFKFNTGMGTLNATTLSEDSDKSIIEIIGTKYSLSFSIGGEILSWPSHLVRPIASTQNALLERQVLNFLDSVGDSKNLEVTALSCRHTIHLIQQIYKSNNSY